MSNSIVDSFLEFPGLKALGHCQTFPDACLVKGNDYTVVLTGKWFPEYFPQKLWAIV